MEHMSTLVPPTAKIAADFVKITEFTTPIYGNTVFEKHCTDT